MTIQYNFINSSNNNKKRKTEAASLSLSLLGPRRAAELCLQRDKKSVCTARFAPRAEKDLGAHFLRRPKSRTETFAYQAKII
jgi:hypothetical protein